MVISKAIHGLGPCNPHCRKNIWWRWGQKAREGSRAGIGNFADTFFRLIFIDITRLQVTVND
jgi:hypothetical protein